MRVFSAVLGAAGILLLPLSTLAASRPHHHTASHAMLRHAGVGHVTHTEHAYATVSMSSERATEIQTALIEKGYLAGEPTGSWDASTSAAMGKLQSDNGWQTKLVPDSRALIKLGLGPGTTPPTPAVNATPATSTAPAMNAVPAATAAAAASPTANK